jgi:methionyl aminopeptidase
MGPALVQQYVATAPPQVICHGIPDDRELQSGDIVNVDISVWLNGYHGDLNEVRAVARV